MEPAELVAGLVAEMSALRVAPEAQRLAAAATRSIPAIASERRTLGETTSGRHHTVPVS